MTNPFENEDGQFSVLVNDEEQYSLWPDAIAVPDGWKAVYGPAGRAECLRFVEETWTDMRPTGARN